MPKLVHRTPACSLHKNSGQAVVALNGVDVYLGRFGTEESRRAYDRAVAEWLTNGRRIAAPRAANAPVPLTVGEMIARYWTFAEGSSHARAQAKKRRKASREHFASRPTRRKPTPVPSPARACSPAFRTGTRISFATTRRRSSGGSWGSRRRAWCSDIRRRP